MEHRLETQSRYLFSLDIDGIQDYILKTDKLRTIAGASAIITRLNNKETADKLDDFIEDNKIPQERLPSMVYSDGGATKITFYSREDANAFARKMHREYAQYGITITTHVQEYLDKPSKTLEAAEVAIQRKKLQKDNTISPIGSPYFRVCDACGNAYAGCFAPTDHNKDKQDSENKNPLLLCHACSKKENEDIETFSFPKVDKLKFDPRTDQIADKAGWLAWVLIDGNAFGRHIEKLIKEKDESHEAAFNELTQFSDNLRNIIGTALYESIDKSGPPSAGRVEAEKTTFFRPIIIGGDDICFVINAKYAFSFVNYLMEKLEEAKTTDMPKAKLTFSAGMVLTKKKFPFNVAYRIGESLLKSAKKRWIAHSQSSVIDFHVMQSGTADTIEKIRETEYSYTDTDRRSYMLTRKPYTLSEFNNLEKDIDQLRKTKLGSRTKLKQIAGLLRNGKEGAELELLKLAAKMSQKDSANFHENFIAELWKSENGYLTTRLFDLVELAEFMTDKQSGAVP